MRATLVVLGLLLVGCTTTDDGDVIQPSVTQSSPSTTVSLETTSTVVPEDLPYAETMEVAVADIEAFWAVQFPAVFGQEFEPVAEVVGYHPSRPETVPDCGGDPLPPYNAAYCTLNDIIGYDAEVLFPELYESFGDVAIAVVLAHEYGHAIAARLGIDVPTIMGEQQSDCMAGAWVGSLAERGGYAGLIVTPDDLSSAIAANLQVADPVWLGSMTPGAHGSGFDRIRAFAEGYEGGVIVCSGYAIRPPDLVDLPFDLRSATPSDEALDVLIPAVVTTLEAFWGFVFPGMSLPEVSPFSSANGPPPVCAGSPVAAGGAVFCSSDGVVYYDTAAQQELWESTGDAAATYSLIHAWTQAVVNHLATIDTAETVVLTSDCLAGVWHRKLVADYQRLVADDNARPRYSLFVAAGDIDEILAGLLLSTPIAPDGVVAELVSPFDRAGAFGDGFLEGEISCGLDGPGPGGDSTPSIIPVPDETPGAGPVQPPPPFESALDLEPGWTNFTSTDGLPGNDVVGIDVNIDGTAWAIVALDRVVEGDPAAVGFARYEDGAWRSIPITDPIDGPVQLAAGPNGTAWVVGGGRYPGDTGVRYGGTAGVWHFDGRSWRQVQGEPGPGEPLPVRDAAVGSDGVLWASGLSDVTSSTTGLLSHDGTAWSTFDLPVHLFDCIDCHGVHLDSSDAVWISYGDYDEAADEQLGYLARLDGETWVPVRTQDATVFELPMMLAGLGFVYDRSWGLDDVFVVVAVADVQQEVSGVPLPTVGSVVGVRAVTFDGEQWSEVAAGEMTIGFGNTLIPGIVTEQGSLGGPTGFAAAHHNGLIYVSGLGGVQVIDPDGAVSTLTVNDGLGSNATHDVTVGPGGEIWVATNGGVSVFVPD